MHAVKWKMDGQIVVVFLIIIIKIGMQLFNNH